MSQDLDIKAGHRLPAKNMPVVIRNYLTDTTIDIAASADQNYDLNTAQFLATDPFLYEWYGSNASDPADVELQLEGIELEMPGAFSELTITQKWAFANSVQLYVKSGNIQFRRPLRNHIRDRFGLALDSDETGKIAPYISRGELLLYDAVTIDLKATTFRLEIAGTPAAAMAGTGVRLRGKFTKTADVAKVRGKAATVGGKMVCGENGATEEQRLITAYNAGIHQKRTR